MADGTGTTNCQTFATTGGSIAKASNNKGIRRSISGNNLSFNNSNSSRKPLVYLDQVLRQWTSDPANQVRDKLVPGSSLETLNQIFEIRE